MRLDVGERDGGRVDHASRYVPHAVADVERSTILLLHVAGCPVKNVLRSELAHGVAIDALSQGLRLKTRTRPFESTVETLSPFGL